MADDWKPRTGQRIEALYAWVATEADGGEGVVGAHIPGLGGMVPLVGADRERIESFRPWAENVRRASGCAIRLKRFSHVDVIDELTGAANDG